MKKIILAAAIVIISGFSVLKAQPFNDMGGSYGLFYNQLAPYGTWIEVNNGVVVWRPQGIDPGWSPYTEGRWAWTANGWYWDSYEPFGYIVYHYGRWYYDNYYGWIWVPDNQWAPAWVEWRYDNNYIGWCPLPPYAGFSVNVGINFSINYVSPYRFWRFVDYHHFCDPYVYHYYVPSRYTYGIYNKTVYRTNYGFENGRVVNRGVDVNLVRNRSGQRITETKVRVVSNPRDLRTTGRSNDRNEIRAFVATREELAAKRGNDVVIERGRQRSSLDINKVQVNRTESVPRVIGHENESIRSNNAGRNNNREVIPNERTNQRVINNNRTPQNESPVIIRKNTPSSVPPARVREGNTNNNRQMEKPRPNIQKSSPPQRDNNHAAPQRGDRNEQRNQRRR